MNGLDVISIEISFAREDIRLLSGTPPSEPHELLEALLCEIAFFRRGENLLAKIAKGSKPSSTGQLVLRQFAKGRLGAVLWAEATENILDALSSLVSGEVEAEADLAGSLFDLRLSSSGGRVTLSLLDDGDRLWHLGQASAPDEIRAISGACRTSLDSVNSLVPKAASSALFDALHKKLQSFRRDTERKARAEE